MWATSPPLSPPLMAVQYRTSGLLESWPSCSSIVASSWIWVKSFTPSPWKISLTLGTEMNFEELKLKTVKVQDISRPKCLRCWRCWLGWSALFRGMAHVFCGFLRDVFGAIWCCPSTSFMENMGKNHKWFSDIFSSKDSTILASVHGQPYKYHQISKCLPLIWSNPLCFNQTCDILSS